MSDYCSSTDVSILLGVSVFSTTSTPTLAQVNTIVTDVTNEIDFTLSGIGINSQPTDARILAKLKMICKYGAAGMIGFSRFSNNTGVDGTQPNKYLEKYYEYLKDITVHPESYGIIAGSESIYMSSNVIDGTNTETEINSGFTKRDYDF